MRSARVELRSLGHKQYKPRELTIAEASQIIEHISEGRNRLFATLALWSGMRPGELAGLRVRNLDRLRSVVTVESTVEDIGGVLSVGLPKTTKSCGRRIPIPKPVTESLGTYIDENHMTPEAFLFAMPRSASRAYKEGVGRSILSAPTHSMWPAPLRPRDPYAAHTASTERRIHTLRHDLLTPQGRRHGELVRPPQWRVRQRV